MKRRGFFTKLFGGVAIGSAIAIGVVKIVPMPTCFSQPWWVQRLHRKDWLSAWFVLGQDRCGGVTKSDERIHWKSTYQEWLNFCSAVESHKWFKQNA